MDDLKVMCAGPFRFLTADPVVQTLMRHIDKLERQNAIYRESIGDLRTMRRDVRMTRKATAALLRPKEADTHGN